jgi:cell division control protein 6
VVIITDDENTAFGLDHRGIIKDGYPLTSFYRPTNILARDTEKLEIGKLFAPVLKYNGSPINALVYGKSGTGKNLVVEYITDLFIQSAEKRGKKYISIVVSCKMRTPKWILQQLLSAVDPSLSDYGTGRSVGEVYTKLHQNMKRKNASLVVILDEIDALPPSDLLYDLSRIKKDLPQDLYLVIIGLTNNFNEHIKDIAISSSFGRRTIDFPSYTTENLRDILNDRLFALYPDTLETGVIEYIAKKSAIEHGNARKAIELLATSAEFAENEKDPQITSIHVNRASDYIEIDNLIKDLIQSPKHTVLAFIAIAELQHKLGGSAVLSSPLYKHYCIVCDENLLTPLSSTRFATICSSLGSTGLIDVTERVGSHQKGRTRVHKITLTENRLHQIMAVLAKEHGYIINGLSTQKLLSLPDFNEK